MFRPNAAPIPCSIMLTTRTSSPVSAPSLVCFSVGKGFGDAAKGGPDERTRKQQKSKRVNVRREEAPIPNQGNIDRGGNVVNPTFAAVSALEEEMQKKEEEADFSMRLAAMKLEGEGRRRDTKRPAPTGGSSSGPRTVDAGAAVFDTGLDYSSPPSLSDTLLSQLNADVSDPALKTADIGPNQIALAAGAGGCRGGKGYEAHRRADDAALAGRHACTQGRPMRN